MSDPLFFAAYAEHLMARLAEAGLLKDVSLADLERRDLGSGHPDSRITTFLDQLPGYRAGDRETAQRHLSSAQIFSAHQERHKRDELSHAALRETYLDPVSGEFRFGKNPVQGLIIVKECVTVFKFGSR